MAGNEALGARLREERRRLGWDKPRAARELARVLGDDRPDHSSLITYLKRWENGTTGISERYRLALAAIYGIPRAELFPPEHPQASLWRPIEPPDATADPVNPDDEERLLKAACKPARVDLAVVDSLSTVLAAQRRTEDAIGSVALIAPVRAQLDSIQGLVSEARGKLRPDVVHMAGQWAQFYGWLQANAGNLAVGGAWLDRALEWAIEADEVNLVSEVLSFKGHVAWMAEQVGPMIGLSAAAIRQSGLYPGQYAISAAQKARGHAMAGDAYETERDLALADEHAAAARQRAEEAPPWLYYHSPGFFDLQRGLAYRYLGRHDPAYNRHAVEALKRGLENLPPEMRRSEWAGEFVYQLGRAHRQGREHEEAEARAAELADMAERIDSNRLRRQAAALLGTPQDAVGHDPCPGDDRRRCT